MTQHNAEKLSLLTGGEICCKALHRIDGDLVSACTGGAWLCKYAVGRPAFGFRGTPVMVFSHASYAKAFVDLGDEVWEGTATNLRTPSCGRDDAWCVLSDDVRFEFWREARQGSGGAWLRPWPEGTMWADSFTPLRQITGR
jgi:hypothetical protein